MASILQLFILPEVITVSFLCVIMTESHLVRIGLQDFFVLQRGDKIVRSSLTQHVMYIGHQYIPNKPILCSPYWCM